MPDLFSILSQITKIFIPNQMTDYILGVLFAILAGINNNIGIILQKKVVNKVASDAKFFRSLVKKPLWLTGFLLEFGSGSVLFILAQSFIGPTLIPGLMAAGLIILAIGSTKIVGEELKKSEWLGIILMVFAIAFIGFSNMEIDIAQQNFLEIGLIIRIIIFTVALFIFTGICKILDVRGKYKGISLAVLSGFMFALSNFWISPLLGTIAHVFSSTFVLLELIIFSASSIILVLVNIYGLATIQQSFRVGQASNMIPIQQVPIQIAPPFYFLFVFLIPLNNIISLVYLTIGIALVIFSSYLLARRQAEIEKIK